MVPGSPGNGFYVCATPLPWCSTEATHGPGETHQRSNHSTAHEVARVPSRRHGLCGRKGSRRADTSSKWAKEIPTPLLLFSSRNVPHLLKSLERATRKDKRRSSSARNSRDVQDNPGLNGSLSLRKRCWKKDEGLAPLKKKKSNMTLERQERVLGAAEGCLLSRNFRFKTVILERRCRGKGKTRPKGGSVQQKKLVMTATVVDAGLVIRSVRRKTKMMRRHMSRVVPCKKQCTLILSHMSRAQFR